MYKISDFSKITSLSAKALRYYDEEQILTPSRRDGETGYRYYSEEDYKKAQLVVLLRSLEFSISEIKEVLANCSGLADLPCYLEEKKKMIEGRIVKEKELIKKLNLYIKPKDREDISMNYQIEEKEIAPVTVAAIRYKGKYSDVGKYIGTLYKAVKGDAAGGAHPALSRRRIYGGRSRPGTLHTDEKNDQPSGRHGEKAARRKGDLHHSYRQL